MKLLKKLSFVLALALAWPMANAGLIEDLLAIPAIQSLLGRQPELQAVVQRCADVRYKQRNPAICQQAEEANRLAKMPPELRAVLANPTTAKSLRELCLAVQAGALNNSYLCAELYKAESGFKAQADQQRQAAEAVIQQRATAAQQNRESMDR